MDFEFDTRPEEPECFFGDFDTQNPDLGGPRQSLDTPPGCRILRGSPVSTTVFGLSSWVLIPGEGPSGGGPGVSSGRSPEPAGGTEQTGKGRAEGRPKGGPQITECTATGEGVPQYRKRGIAGCKKVESTPGQPRGQQQFFFGEE